MSIRITSHIYVMGDIYFNSELSNDSSSECWKLHVLYVKYRNTITFTFCTKETIKYASQL